MEVPNLAAEEKVPSRKVLELWVVLAIFLVALTLRVVNILQFKAHDPMFEKLLPGFDMYTFQEWGKNILNTHWLDRENTPPLQAPLYPYTLALLMAVFGTNTLWVKLFQAFMGSLSCVLLYIIGKKVFSQRVGAVAALMMSFYGMFLLYESLLLMTTLQTFLYLLSILSLLVAKEKGGILSHLTAGICLGLSIVCSPNIILFVPLALLWLWLVSRDGIGRKLGTLAVLVAGIIIMIVPVTLKNYFVGGEKVLISKNGGICFYIGNCYDSIGTITVTDSMLRIAPKFLSMTPREIAQIDWFGKAIEQIKRRPGHFFVMLFKKFVLYWVGYEVPNNVNYYLSKRFSAVLRLPLLPFWLVFPLAVVGVIASRKEWPKQALLLLFICAYTLSIVAIFVLARFRLPMVPYLIIFAGYAVVWWYDKIKVREYRSFALSLIPFVIVGIFSFGTRSGYIRENDYLNLGIAYQTQNRCDLGAPEFVSALKVDPYYYPAREKLIDCYLSLGQLEQAEQISVEGTKLHPRSARPFFDVARVSEQRGQVEDAIRNLEEAVKLDPKFLDAHRKLAQLYLKAGLPSKARVQWQAMLNLKPDDAEASENLDKLGQTPER